MHVGCHLACHCEKNYEQILISIVLCCFVTLEEVEIYEKKNQCVSNYVNSFVFIARILHAYKHTHNKQVPTLRKQLIKNT